MKTLLKLLAIIVLFFQFGCSNPGTTVIVTGTEPEPIPITGPEPPEELGEIKLVLYTSEQTKFSDGVSIWTWQEGNVKKAHSKIYSHENIVYKLDQNGATVDGRTLVTEPDAISIDPVYKEEETTTKGIGTEEINLKDSAIWLIKDISAKEAEAMGALPKMHTQYFCDALEYGHWYDNQYECDKIVVFKDDIFGRKTNGAWFSVTGNKSGIKYLVDKENGFAIYDYDNVNRTATIDGVSVSWTYNFFAASTEWLLSDGVWYAQNGYTWDGTALVEDGSEMITLRPKQNVILACGTRFENGEDVLYYMSCSEGYLLRYVPSVNQLNTTIRLYKGDGKTTTGVFYKQSLSPVIDGDYLYFICDAETYRYNFVTGLTSHFIGGVSEVWEY